MEDNKILNNEDDTPIKHIPRQELSARSYWWQYSYNNSESTHNEKIKMKNHRSKKWRNGIKSKKK